MHNSLQQVTTTAQCFSDQVDHVKITLSSPSLEISILDFSFDQETYLSSVTIIILIHFFTNLISSASKNVFGGLGHTSRVGVGIVGRRYLTELLVASRYLTV